jgi:CheY-like chemotaxis protein
VVEDDADVRRIVTRQIAELGYSVMEAQNPKEAMAILKNPAKRIDLLFTDLVMPGGMNGHELARAALAERPDLAVLFTSGYSGTALRSEERLKEGEHFLSKPYRKEDLARKLREIFAR